MKIALIVIGIFVGSVTIFGLLSITISNDFKDKLSHIEMLQQTIEENPKIELLDSSPQALRIYAREKANKQDLIYAYNLKVAEYNSMANRFPYSIFRGSYPIALKQYHKQN